MMPHDAVGDIFEDMGFPRSRAWLPGAVAYSVGRTYTLLVRALAKDYARFGLSVPSFNLLMLLKHGRQGQAMTQQALGQRLVVSPSDMTGLIDRLERRGLARRTPGRDRREKILRITPAGSKLLETVWPRHVETVTRLAGAIGVGEARHLVATLGKLRARYA